MHSLRVLRKTGGIAVVELTTPVGYTSGGCVNAGAALMACCGRDGVEERSKAVEFHALRLLEL